MKISTLIERGLTVGQLVFLKQLKMTFQLISETELHLLKCDSLGLREKDAKRIIMGIDDDFDYELATAFDAGIPVDHLTIPEPFMTGWAVKASYTLDNEPTYSEPFEIDKIEVEVGIDKASFIYFWGERYPWDSVHCRPCLRPE